MMVIAKLMPKSCVYIRIKVPHISIEKYTTYKLERNNFVHKE